MKVLIVNTSERVGGASVAASRLLKALNKNGVDAKMLVNNKNTDDSDVLEIPGKWRKKIKFVFERFLIFLLNGFSKKNLFDIDPAFTGTNITRLDCFKEADVIHLHWINQGMLSLKNLRQILQSGKPVVWTMHDFWSLMAVCHSNKGCLDYLDSCQSCTLVRTRMFRGVVKRIYKTKYVLLHSNRVEFIAVSSWEKAKAETSRILGDNHISLIPNMLNIENDFILMERKKIRRELHLPEGKKVLLFGAARVDAPIKRVDILIEAINRNIDVGVWTNNEVVLIVFGEIRNRDWIKGLKIEMIEMGLVVDAYELSKLYSAADCLVSSSLEETFGQTLIEAQACGCLPVAFDSGGPRDIIKHLETGYLAKPMDIGDLSKGMAWALNQDSEEIRVFLREYAIAKFSEEKIVKDIISLYSSVI